MPNKGARKIMALWRMNTRFSRAALAVALVLGSSHAIGQTTTNELSARSPAPASAETTNRWAFAGSVYTYFVPDSRDYVQPTFSADRQWLHLEARYNDESLNTASTWLGYNLGGDEKLSWKFTPMLGGVFGNTTGVAPGYEGSLSWWKIELYSEGEYVFDVGNYSKSYFYNWSELSLAPVDWFRFGLVTQRTRLYRTDRDIQRGVLAGIRYKKVECTAYVLNPDESKPTFILAFSLSL
jgi:hypothetical protein